MKFLRLATRSSGGCAGRDHEKETNRDRIPHVPLTGSTFAHQRDRVLRQLIIHRGPDGRGITQADFHPPRIIDGGPPIARLASRIDELRNHDGFTIVDAGWRSGFRVYRLVDEAPLEILEDLPEPPPRLFDDEGVEHG